VWALHMKYRITSDEGLELARQHIKFSEIKSKNSGDRLAALAFNYLRKRIERDPVFLRRFLFPELSEDDIQIK
jgi:hypothetical protein